MSTWEAGEYIEVADTRAVSLSRWTGVPQSSFWSRGCDRESRRHRIHAYPAKFPSFIASKAFAVAKQKGTRVRRVADVFCGCGTVAYEARREGYDFWGCDINPVATLIARTKGGQFKISILNCYFAAILAAFDAGCDSIVLDEVASTRISYWYDDDRKSDLARLLFAIRETVSAKSKYRDFFACGFSNILKSTSRCLTKSIKPQIDPHKTPAPVRAAYIAQIKNMLKAFSGPECFDDSPSKIITGNVLDGELPNNIDLIITSPPYVTSYEYADLHQLSSLWLGFATDYRTLREGSIGSSQHSLDFNREIKRLNSTGGRVVFSLFDKDRSIARAVANYYLDMQHVAKRCKRMLGKDGLALFVIGDTEYKGVKVENALHLTEALLTAGFSRVKVTKRAVSGKILTPYRTVQGRFTRSSDGRSVYSEEFVLIAEK